MLDWHEIEVEISGEPPNTCVKIDHDLDLGGTATSRIATSRPLPRRLSEDDFPPHLVSEVDSRLGSTEELGYLNGASKGRVIYLLVEEEPFAALTYHVSSGQPLLVLGADAIDGLEDGGWAEIEILLKAARATAAALALAADRLEWDSDCDDCVAIADLHGFNPRYPSDPDGRKHQLDAEFAD
jgi:hypothetical protein